jgi:hypothetical protein
VTADTAPVTIGTEIELLKARVRLLEQLITEIRRDLARTSSPVALTAPDGTVAIRDPDILAQEQATGMRGYAPHVPPE